MKKPRSGSPNEKSQARARWKTIVPILIALIIVGGLGFQIYQYYSDRLGERDLVVTSFGWSEYCNGKTYTQQDVTDFCSNCSIIPSSDPKAGCKFPVDMRFRIDRAPKIVAGGAEIHCHMIVDGADLYAESGRYYGIVQPELFTWELLDANIGHEVRFCCGLQRDSLLSSIFGYFKPMDQACVSGSVEARCS